MSVVYLVLYIVAALCFLLTALGFECLPAGLLAWVLVPLIHTAHR